MSIEQTRVLSNSEYNRLLAGYNRAANLERELASVRNGNAQVNAAVERIIREEREQAEYARAEAQRRYDELSISTQRELTRLREVISQQNTANAANADRINDLSIRVDMINRQLDHVNFRVDDLYEQVNFTNERVDAIFDLENRRKENAQSLLSNAENLLSQMRELDYGEEDKEELDRFAFVIESARTELERDNSQSVTAILDAQFNRDMLVHYHILSENYAKRPSLIARANELSVRMEGRIAECDTNEVRFADEDDNITKYPCPVSEWCDVFTEDGENFYETVREHYLSIRERVKTPDTLGNRALEQMINTMEYDLNEVLSDDENSLVAMANENRLRQIAAENAADNLISQSESRGWVVDERHDSTTVGPIAMRISNDFGDSVILSVNPGDELTVYREIFSHPEERTSIEGDITNILSASGIAESEDDIQISVAQGGLSQCSSSAGESMRRLASQKN